MVLGCTSHFYFDSAWEEEKMNKQGAGVIAQLATLIGGVVFIYLLITLFSGGAVLGLVGNKGLIMFIIFLVVLWIITRKK